MLETPPFSTDLVHEEGSSGIATIFSKYPSWKYLFHLAESRCQDPGLSNEGRDHYSIIYLVPARAFLDCSAYMHFQAVVRTCTRGCCQGNQFRGLG